MPAVLFLSATPAVLAGGAETGLDTVGGDPSGAVALSDTLTGGSDSLGAHVPAVLALSDTPAGAVVVPDQPTIAVELVRHDRQVAGPRIADAMRRHGHTVTDRTGLRWRDRAVTHLATELNNDLRGAGVGEVRLAVTAV